MVSSVLPEFVASREVLLLSPHLDDAAFSASALLSLTNTTVWTTFAGVPDEPISTDWDERCGFPDAQALMAARLSEDRAALDDLTFRQLDLLDRAYASPERRAADLTSLRAQLEAWLKEHPRGLLALPAGAGVTCFSSNVAFRGFGQSTPGGSGRWLWI